MKKIAIEEHCRTEYYLKYLRSRKEPPRLESIQDGNKQEVWREWDSAEEYSLWPPRALSKFSDIGEGRLRDMDEAGIDMQVLSSLTNFGRFNATDGAALARKVNEEVSEAVRKYPDRFTGFAALALKNPGGAADELERAVKELGLNGTMLFPHEGGEFIDDKKYWVVFARAVKLGVPVYIHPVHPPLDRRQPYSGYPELAGSLWGFGAETGLLAMRLICSGIFDEYPDLKIILGHLGEALPFWLWRLDNRFLHAPSALMSTREALGDSSPLKKKLKKLPSQYIRDNFFVTTSGMLWQPGLLCTLLALGAEKILFAVDYPMESSQEAVRFMEAVPICDSDKEKIFHLNAERLLGL